MAIIISFIINFIWNLVEMFPKDPHLAQRCVQYTSYFSA